MSNEEIVAEVQNGNNSLMFQLWENVSKLAKKLAYRLYTALEGRRGLTIDDLMQTAYVALCDAVSTYKPGEALFSTWYVIYLKKHFFEAAGLHGKSKNNDPLHNAASLEQPLVDGEDISLADSIEDPAASGALMSVEDRIWLDQLREALDKALESIPDIYREILNLRYYHGMTLEAAGKTLGISSSQAQQREIRGIRKLNDPKIAADLIPFYDFDFYCNTGLSSFRRTGQSVQEYYILKKEELRDRQRKQKRANAKAEDERTMQLLRDAERFLSERRTGE